MQYEWEPDAKRQFLSGKLPDHFRVIGVAVENTDTGEAALIMLDEPDGSVTAADCWQDVLGDAERHYDMSKQMMAVAYADRATEDKRDE